MSQLLLQVVIVVALGAFCFGGGYLTGFIVTRNRWLDEMIKRGVARSVGRGVVVVLSFPGGQPAGKRWSALIRGSTATLS